MVYSAEQHCESLGRPFLDPIVPYVSASVLQFIRRL